MTEINVEKKSTEFDSAEQLSQAFLRNFPLEAARKLETMQEGDAVDLLLSASPAVQLRLWNLLTVPAATRLLPTLDTVTAERLLKTMDVGPCAALLARLDSQEKGQYLSLLDDSTARELRELMDYPTNTAGYLMDSKVLSFREETLVSEALVQLKRYPEKMRRVIYILDADMRLRGQVNLERLVFAEHSLSLADLYSPVIHLVSALDLKEDITEIVQKNALDSLPVVDIHQRILGVIRGAQVIEALKEDFSGDLQAMVGVSRDEQALSSSFFAVKKRQPWLQINLLTGFLAASVVGMFESTIAQFTALAVLMPVAAGQSGNTGAQALAVTMRGLTLREITTRHWFRVMLKEAGAGLLNGLAIAITCGLGVFVWSRSLGLALVLAFAMIISMTIAGIAGAFVPIILKKLGQDPAQSSSIILTTITDIAGFMSFLGIASLMSSYLV